MAGARALLRADAHSVDASATALFLEPQPEKLKLSAGTR